MPRNRSEKAPQYSPTVTAWLIASHKHRALQEANGPEEYTLYMALLDHERAHWGPMSFRDVDPIAKQVYDAQKSK